VEHVIEATLPKSLPSTGISEEIQLSNSVGGTNTNRPEDIRSFLQGQKPISLNALITDTELARIKKNPWEINLTATLQAFHKRIYQNSEIKFRIGGRVISSASQIVRAKAKFVIQESQETQDDLHFNEVDDLPDDDEYDYSDGDGGMSPQETMSSILSGLTGGKAGHSPEERDHNTTEEIRAYTELRDAELAQDVPTDRFFSVNREGQHFLASPIREVFQKIDFGDLNNALLQTLKRQLRQPSRRMQDPFKKHIPKILADNILAKAKEDRARVEEQIEKMHQRIITLFTNDQPVPFLTLIITADPDGIVRTLLYLLQLVNRKKVELWQKLPDTDDSTDDSVANSTVITDTGLDIFVTPTSTLATTKKSLKKTPNKSTK
jgi:chromatin segregation and condensation protein Rec8/ScpA/Scc1 (kleisin family)